jgi:hypothetical protein
MSIETKFLGLLALAAATAFVIPAASAQAHNAAAPPTNSRVATVKACNNEQNLKQVLQSNGAYAPEGCRKITVTRLDTPAGALCMMDFAPGKHGILGEIRSVAATTQWWLPCNNLHAP